MINEEWSAAQNYRCCLYGHRKWYVTKSNLQNPHQDEEDVLPREDDGLDDEQVAQCSDPQISSVPKNGTGVLPVFNRVYHTYIDEENVLKCSCKNQERMGFPCRHIACVIRSEPSIAEHFPDGFPLSAVSVMWHTSYYLYGISDDPNHQQIKQTYMELQRNDTPGVCIPFDTIIPEPRLDAMGEETHPAAADCVWNYSAAHVRKCLETVISNAQFPQHSSIIPAGMTQQSNVNYSDDSDDDCFTLQNEPSYTERVLQDSSDNHALDNQDCFSRFKAMYRDACNIVDCLDDGDDKEALMQELQMCFRNVYRQGMSISRKQCADRTNVAGKKFAMLPPVSKKRKTHGTNYHK